MLEQAERLIRPAAGAPRQADLRRAVSSAYYAVFHFVVVRAADQVIGRASRADPLYGLVYRNIEHRSLRALCLEAQKVRPSPQYARFVPDDGFGEALRASAMAVLDLQEKRHSADYDPLVRIRQTDASAAIRTARSALDRFAEAAPEHLRIFLTLLLFPPR